MKGAAGSAVALNPRRSGRLHVVPDTPFNRVIALDPEPSTALVRTTKNTLDGEYGDGLVNRGVFYLGSIHFVSTASLAAAESSRSPGRSASGH